MPDETSSFDYFPKSAGSLITPVTSAMKTPSNNLSYNTPVVKESADNVIKSKTNKTALPANLSLAIAYIVFQENLDMYSSDEGFEKGTMFPDLYKPFTGKRSVI